MTMQGMMVGLMFKIRLCVVVEGMYLYSPFMVYAVMASDTPFNVFRRVLFLNLSWSK
jgi:hypothetical protein